MPQAHYSIRVYSSAGSFLRVLPLVRSARYRQAENEVGDFDVTVPWKTDDIPTLLSPPNLIEFWRDGVFVFGGIIRRQNATQEGNVAFYTASGPSYLQWLVDSRIRPSTGTADVLLDGSFKANTIRNVVRTHVNDTNRYFSTEADETSTLAYDEFAATGYETVLETAQRLATSAGNISFDIVRDGGQLIFRVFHPSRGPDKSLGTQSPVLFDLRGGNITNAEWTRDGSNVVNALWGGGPGDKAARYIYPAGVALTDVDSIVDWGRIEGFIDAGSETTTNTDKKVAEELKRTAGGEESVTFKVTAFGRYQLGTHFDFGTRVTVMWDPILQFTDTIRGIEVRLDESSGVAQVDINVGDTITGDSQTRASIYLGKFLRQMRRTISVQTRH